MNEIGDVTAYHAKSAPEELNLLLGTLIWRHMDYGVVAVIREPEFKDVVPQPFPSFFGSPYKIGVEACLSYTSLFYRKKRSVSYLIESGNKNASAVRSYLDEVLERPESRRDYALHSVRWVGKEEPMIHPADLIAHETATCVDSSVTPLLRILMHRIQILDLNRAQLEAYARDLVEARQTIRAHKKKGSIS